MATLVHRACARALLLGALASAACSSPSTQSPDLAANSQIHINGQPTGSIQVPSLCDRIELDTRVTFTGVGSFAFAWTGSQYQVVYVDLEQHTVYVVHLSNAGVILDAPQVMDQTSGTSSLPSLLATPSGYVVAWQNETKAPTVRVHALDLSGVPSGETQLVATGRSAQMRPVLSPSPNGTAIAWMDQAFAPMMALVDLGDSTTYVGLLDDSLALRTDVPQRQINSSSPSGYPWLAGDATQLSLVWSADLTGRTDVYFTPLDAQLAPLSAVDVRDVGGMNAALLGRLARTDFGHLAAWEDQRTGDAEVYMALMDPAGNRFAGGLVEEPNTGNANWPHIAWTGSSAAIVYYQFRGGKPQVFMTFLDEYGARVGGAADAQVSNTPMTARFPDVVWNGSEFAVIWIDTRDGQQELYFNRASCKRPAPI